MLEEIKKAAAYLWQEQRGKTVGILLGLVLSLSVLIFGIMNTAFVAVCILVGLYFGSRYDHGEDLFLSAKETISPRLRKWDNWR